MNYVKRLRRETGINGNLRFLLMMIASRIPKGRIETIPTSLRYLSWTTGNDERTVRNLRNKLVALNAVRIGDKGRGRGRFQTYILPALAGPLFMVPDDTGKAETPSGLSPPGKLENASGFSMPGKAENCSCFVEKNRKGLPRAVRTASSRAVRTSESTTAAAGKPVAAEIYRIALDYLDWFGVTYSEHHDGAKVTLDLEVDGPIVVRLLTTPQRTVERLQAMTLAMWTATAAEDPWLARAADRGLRLLKHAADRLDRIVGERARRAATPEQRDQAQTRQEVLNRAIVRLRECPVAALRAPCGEAVARLLAGDDIAAVDAALVAAARGACDVEQLETAARQEFIAMRHRSSADGFERLVQQQVDRLVRDRAQLPDLLSLANVLDDEWRLAGALR